MIVYPSIDPWPGFDDLLAGIAGEIETHYRGLGRDFYRIRPYEVLESARHLDWKASAHTGSLQVREFAREQERTVEMFLDRDVPPQLDAWFEHAVDCCAFLAWRLSSQGASIHFRSNGYDLRQPEEGDIYTILKYLALVYPQRSSGPEAPLDDTSYKIVFTPSPRQFADAGWMDARLLAPACSRCPLRGHRPAGFPKPPEPVRQPQPKPVRRPSNSPAAPTGTTAPVDGSRIEMGWEVEIDGSESLRNVPGRSSAAGSDRRHRRAFARLAGSSRRDRAPSGSPRPASGAPGKSSATWRTVKSSLPSVCARRWRRTTT